MFHSNNKCDKIKSIRDKDEAKSGDKKQFWPKFVNRSIFKTFIMNLSSLLASSLSLMFFGIKWKY